MIKKFHLTLILKELSEEYTLPNKGGIPIVE